MRQKKTNEFYGTGRRKCAVARVWVEPGDGQISINGRDFKDYLCRPVLEILVQSPLTALDLEGKYNVKAYVKGGGVTGQAGAVKLGISRALLAIDEEMRKDLRAGGFLTRDPRVKERKKYGQRGARARYQFSKR